MLEGPGFRIERHGRFIRTVVDRTPEEQRELIDRMASSVDTLSTELVQKAAELETRLKEYDSFNVLGGLSLQNHLVDPETYEEISHKGKSFVAEYAALLVLKSPYSKGTRLYANGAALGDLQNRVEDVLQSAVWLQMAKDARSVAGATSVAAAPEPHAIRDLQMLSRLNELAVRNPAYEHHHHEVLRGLFAPFAGQLYDLLGFSVDEAIILSETIRSRIGRLFHDRLDKAYSEVKKLGEEVNLARRRKTRKAWIADVMASNQPDTSAHIEYVQDLAKRSIKKVRRYLNSAAIEWVFLAAGDICSFSANELAEEAGVAANRTKAFLDALSIDFGTVPADFAEPALTHPLKTRPVIRHEDRFMVPAIMLLDWAIQPLFEETFKKVTEKVWEGYQRHRHDWLLSAAIGLLRRAMPAAQFSTNLFYDVEGDRSKRAELDGLGQYDSIVFLLEAKGQNLTEPARRGAPMGLRQDLRQIIAESHEQALRAKAYLDSARKGGSSQAVHFSRERGSDVVVELDSMDQVVLLSVTLAPIGHLTAQLHADSPMELFRPGEYSWVVNLYDLMVIADVLDLPAAFPHYVTRRVQTAHLGLLEAADELDIFGYYLKEGLYLDDVAARLRRNSANMEFRLLSYTGPFDAYYAHVTGARSTPAPKPAQAIPPALRFLLERLENSSLPGRLEIALAILDLDSSGRDALSDHAERAYHITAEEMRASNATVAGQSNGGWGITYWSDSHPAAIPVALEQYCARKRTESAARKWFGIGEIVGRERREVVAIVRQGPDRHS